MRWIESSKTELRILTSEQVNQEIASLSHKQRTSHAHPPEMYKFTNYLAYILYPPLYIAGPIITFNDFMSQVNRLFVIFRSPN